jgi:hypothetical protein
MSPSATTWSVRPPVRERCEDSYWLCHVRSPEGIIVELVEQIG